MKIQSLLFCSLAAFATCVASVSAQTVTSYDSSVANWFGAGNFTYVSYIPDVGNPQFNSNGVTNAIMAWNSNANQSPQVYSPGTFAGAIWTAPISMEITNVDVTYIGLYPDFMSISVWGAGTDGIYDTQLYAFAPTDFTNLYATGAQSASFALPAGITSLQFRAWEVSDTGSYEVAGLGTGWNSQFQSVTITTNAVPEPATLGLAVLASAGLLGARRLRASRRAA